MDWLQPIMRPSQFFQRKDIDIGVVKVNVMMYVSDLEKMKDGPPTYFSQLEEDLKDGDFKNHRIAKNASNFNGVKRKFLQAMINNMRERFPDSETMFKLSVLGMWPIQFVPGI